MVLLAAVLLSLAEPAPPTPAKNPGQVAVTVSGGASQGAYEAGYLHYITELLRSDLPMPQIRLLAGTSAGSINTLLTIISTHGAVPHNRPEDSVFWRVWIPLSLQELFKPEETTAVGLLSRRPLEEIAAKIEAVWQQGLAESCDLVWAVPATRLRPRSVTLAHGGLELPRTEEKFVLRIRGRGLGKPPSVRNYVDEHLGIEQAKLLTDPNGEVSFSTIKKLIFASSAFPGAFSPQPLTYCLTAVSSDTCPEADAVEALFLDGGVLDNSPLRLGVRTLGAGLRPDGHGGLAWLDAPHLDEMQIPPEMRIGFVTPEAADYPTFEARQTESMPDSLITLGVEFATSFVAVARSKEFYTIMEERPELRQAVYIPRRRIPTYSALLGEFLGFFEHDFRIFDFVLGMAEARRNMNERIERASQQGEKLDMRDAPEVRAAGADSSAWPLYRCLTDVLGSPPDPNRPIESCHVLPHNQRVLTQVALTRLYDNCERLEDASLQKTHNAHCLAASHGAEPLPLLAPAHADDWHRHDDEPELRYVLRLLDMYGFEFTDLGLPARDADQAPARIRGLLDAMTQAGVARQSGTSWRLVALGTRLAIDTLTQVPTSLIWFATLAETLEGGVSWLLPIRDNRSVRLNGTVLLDGLGRLITSNGGKISVGAAAGLELEPFRFDEALLQLRALVRAGYMLGQGDRFNSQTCTNHAGEDLGDCSRVITQVGVGATVLENLRLQVIASLYPPIRSDEHLLWAVTPGVGVQF